MCLEPQIKAVTFIYIFKGGNLDIRKELIFEERKNGLEKVIPTLPNVSILLGTIPR